MPRPRSRMQPDAATQVKQPAFFMPSSVQPVPTLTTTSLAVLQEPASDTLVTVLSIVALITSAAALGLVYLVFSASSLS